MVSVDQEGFGAGLVSAGAGIIQEVGLVVLGDGLNPMDWVDIWVHHVGPEAFFGVHTASLSHQIGKFHPPFPINRAH